MTTKLCKDCNTEKPLEEFAKHPRAGYQCRCKLCQRVVSKQWYSDNKERQKSNVERNRNRYRQAFKVWKNTLSCIVCGENFGPCLDFHHINDDKDTEVSLLMSNMNLDAVVTELNKCVVLCANCHRKVHCNIIQLSSPTLLSVTKELFYTPVSSAG